MNNKYYYAKKIQPEKYLGEYAMREKFQPFEIGCWGETLEEARKEVLECIDQEIKRLIAYYKALEEAEKNKPPFEEEPKKDPFDFQKKANPDKFNTKL